MTDETSEAVAACISRDCQFVHDHTRETPEAPAMPDDAAMAAADAHAAEGYPAHGAAAATAVGWQRGWAAGYAAGREATLADLRNRPACDCGHEFEPDPSWFHLDECSYRRSAVAQQPIERGSADA